MESKFMLAPNISKHINKIFINSDFLKNKSNYPNLQEKVVQSFLKMSSTFQIFIQ